MIEKEKIDVSVLIRYIEKRALRIYPIFTITLLLLLFIPKFSNAMFGNQSWNFIENYLLINPGGIFWALGVEIRYYLLIPLISFIYINCNKISRLIIIILILFIGIYSYGYINTTWFFKPNTASLFPIITPFLLGSSIAMYYVDLNNKLPAKITSSIMVYFGIFGILYAVPAIGKEIFSELLGSEILYHKFFANPLGISISGSILLFGLFKNTGIIKKLFSSYFLCFLGLISYSIYCFHILTAALLGYLVPIIGEIESVVLFVIATIFLSTITYYLIEKPFQNIMNKKTIKNKI